MSGRLAPISSAAVPRRERRLSPESARARPTRVWVMLSIGPVSTGMLPGQQTALVEERGDADQRGQARSLLEGVHRLAQRGLRGLAGLLAIALVLRAHLAVDPAERLGVMLRIRAPVRGRGGRGEGVGAGALCLGSGGLCGGVQAGSGRGPAVPC